MKELFCTQGPAGEETAHIQRLMEAIYYLQRQHINAVPTCSIREYKLDWSYLFSPKGLYNHFQLLTNISILEKLEQAIEGKGKFILQFLDNKPTGPPGEIQKILWKYNDLDGCDPCPCVILLLMAHFKEKPDGIFWPVDISSTPADVERTQLPDSPRLGVS
ncbi:hypothetical protein NL108_016537 [Boleophthalmus pectinirostris]|nr:hypothetical protein NL108_016537 [Boleophthalmus pectinirostris]